MFRTHNLRRYVPQLGARSVARPMTRSMSTALCTLVDVLKTLNVGINLVALIALILGTGCLNPGGGENVCVVRVCGVREEWGRGAFRHMHSPTAQRNPALYRYIVNIADNCINGFSPKTHFGIK